MYEPPDGASSRVLLVRFAVRQALGDLAHDLARRQRWTRGRAHHPLALERKLDERDPRREGGADQAGDLDGEPALAAAAGADERDLPRESRQPVATRSGG